VLVPILGRNRHTSPPTRALFGLSVARVKHPASERAQASAELIAIVPLLIISGLALAQTLVACWALISAGEAARTAARIAHVGGDAEEAAGKALPQLLEPAEVKVGDSDVRIEVQTPMLLPGLPEIPISASAALDPTGGES
jgi:hypothetical protein